MEPAEFMEICAEAEEGRLERLRQLLARPDAASLRISGATLVSACCALGSEHALELAVASLPQQLNAVDSLGFPVLHGACERREGVGLLSRLLEAKALPEQLTADGRYRLGQTSTIYNEGGRTAFHVAATTGDAEIVQLLLKSGPGALDALDSFGNRPRDLAEEQMMLEPGKGHERVFELFGGSSTSLTAAEARARRKAREHELRRRVACQDEERCLQEKMVMEEALRAYQPLDAPLVSGEWPSWGDCASSLEERSPGVFLFQLLPSELCGRVWAEIEHYLQRAEEQQLPRPVRHDGCLDVSQIFPQMLRRISAAAGPALRKLAETPRLRHAFRTKNFPQRDEDFARHKDKYAVTLNVCLRRSEDLQGSRVFFFANDTDPPIYCHEHQVGLAVLHSSKEWHQTEECYQGERGSLILWYD
ncbi:unnamed protein product [Effrenium voratum]|uniref:Prolyl 4-hydroxylase alpha subunit domain-containing protein n=1 Tax=Effrenium voratum TaxID=2562239 RepID=A0AA36N9G7_9DINO|nr:unnamed protein product [Effrenium voratum]